MGVAGDLFVVRRQRCLRIASSSLRDLTSQDPSANIIVLMEGSTKNGQRVLAMIKKVLTKSHIYLGLFFVIYLWLLSLTGLFLNHPKWRVNDYRASAKWIETTFAVTLAAGEDPLEKANHYLRELGLEGELLGVRDVEKEKQFRFDVYKPGNTAKVIIDLESSQARIRTRQMNSIGILNQLHTFGEMKRFDPKKENLTWFATRLWVISMDGLAVGLILLVLTALYMWFQSKKIISGAISLLLGTGIAIIFLFL